MKFFGFALSLFLLLTISVQAQEAIYATKDTIYINEAEAALKALKEGNCTSCLTEYRHAFAISHKSIVSTFRAAVCAFQCQEKEETTS